MNGEMTPVEHFSATLDRDDAIARGNPVARVRVALGEILVNTHVKAEESPFGIRVQLEFVGFGKAAFLFGWHDLSLPDGMMHEALRHECFRMLVDRVQSMYFK